MDAILASDAGTKARPLRLANALVLLSDMKTCRTWAGVAKLMERSRIHDRDNFNKARRYLQGLGALKVHPISTLPEEDRSKAVALKDPDGKWYELDLDWAIGVLSSEVRSTFDTRSNQPDGKGQIDLDGKVKSTPLIYQGSPIDLSHDLLEAIVHGSTADDALRASPLRSESSSLRSEASAYVGGQSSDIPTDESAFGRWIKDNIPDETYHRAAFRLLREGTMTPAILKRMAA
jgi:hypothetical protein